MGWIDVEQVENPIETVLCSENISITALWAICRIGTCWFSLTSAPLVTTSANIYLTLIFPKGADISLIRPQLEGDTRSNWLRPNPSKSGHHPQPISSRKHLGPVDCACLVILVGLTYQKGTSRNVALLYATKVEEAWSITIAASDIAI